MGSKIVPVIRQRAVKKPPEDTSPHSEELHGYKITSLPSSGLFLDLKMLGAFKGVYTVETRVSGEGIGIVVFFSPKKRFFFRNRELKKGLEAIKTLFISQNAPEDFYDGYRQSDLDKRAAFYNSLGIKSPRKHAGILRSLEIKQGNNPPNSSLQQDLVEYILTRNGIDGVIQVIIDPLREVLESEGEFPENNSFFNCSIRVLLHSSGNNCFDTGALHGLTALCAKYGISSRIETGMRMTKGKIHGFYHFNRKGMHPCPFRSVHGILRFPVSGFNGLLPIVHGLPECLDLSIATGNDDVKTVIIGEHVYPRQLKGAPARIPLAAFENHASIWGLTGEGKSRFLYSLSREFIKKGVKTLVIDLKGEYLPAIGEKNIIYLKPGSRTNPFTLNMFKLPGNIATDDHVQFIYNTFTSLIGQENISPQMSELLKKAVTLTIQDKGDFNYFLKAISDPLRLGIKGSYLDSTAAALYQRVAKFSFGTAGKVFNSGKSNINVSSFLKNNVIVDLQLFNTSDNREGLQVFLNTLFHQFFYSLKRARESINIKGNIRNMIIIDESQLVIGYRDRKNREPSIIEKLPWVIRSYGCSMVFAGTDPVISDTLLYNTGLSAVFFTKQSPLIMANILGTTITSYTKLRDKLDKRMFILSLRGKMNVLRTVEFTLPDRGIKQE